MKSKKEIHIIPSGYHKTLCGLDTEQIKGSSLGMLCNCPNCLKIAQKDYEQQ